jgi:hypothetical protein
MHTLFFPVALHRAAPWLLLICTLSCYAWRGTACIFKSKPILSAGATLLCSRLDALRRGLLMAQGLPPDLPGRAPDSLCSTAAVEFLVPFSSALACFGTVSGLAARCAGGLWKRAGFAPRLPNAPRVGP